MLPNRTPIRSHPGHSPGEPQKVTYNNAETKTMIIHMHMYECFIKHMAFLLAIHAIVPHTRSCPNTMSLIHPAWLCVYWSSSSLDLLCTYSLQVWLWWTASWDICDPSQSIRDSIWKNQPQHVLIQFQWIPAGTSEVTRIFLMRSGICQCRMVNMDGNDPHTPLHWGCHSSITMFVPLVKGAILYTCSCMHVATH